MNRIPRILSCGLSSLALVTAAFTLSAPAQAQHGPHGAHGSHGHAPPRAHPRPQYHRPPVRRGGYRGGYGGGYDGGGDLLFGAALGAIAGAAIAGSVQAPPAVVYGSPPPPPPPAVYYNPGY